jgi:uncharacterized protein (TIGR01627 family)
MESVSAKKNRADKYESFWLKVKAMAYSLIHLRGLLYVSKLRKKHGGIQLRPAEIIKIAHAVGKFDACKMLVFGLGNDSPFWCDINSKGRTVFLEDFQPWFDKITSAYPEIEAYPVRYPGNITRWKTLIDQPSQLKLKLQEEVSGNYWDVILVDGPRGHKFSEEIPGRMSSIYTASQLVGKNGYVFVHDAERRVEQAYAAKYLGADHFVEKVRGRAMLQIYHFPG